MLIPVSLLLLPIVLLKIITTEAFCIRVRWFGNHRRLVGHRRIESLEANTNTNEENDEVFIGRTSPLKKMVEIAVKEISGETEYTFGELGSAPRGDEKYEYKVGDITKAVLKEIGFQAKPSGGSEPSLQQLEESVSDWKKDLPLDLIESFYSRFDRRQRINLALTGVQICAEGVVVWGLMTNVCSLITANVAWASSLSVWNSGLTTPVPRAPLFPIGVDQELWRIFVSKLIGFHLLLGPLFLIVRALGTLIGFRRYHYFVSRLSKTTWVSKGGKGRRESPILNKAVALIAAFFLTNIFLSALVAGATFSFTGALTRLWITLNSLR